MNNLRYFAVPIVGLYLSACTSGVSVTDTQQALNSDSNPSISRVAENDMAPPNDDNETTSVGTNEVVAPIIDTSGDGADTDSANSDNKENDTIQSNETTVDHNFTLSIDNDRRALYEGDSDGTNFRILVVPAGNQDIDIRVRERSDADAKSVSVELTKQRLNKENTNSIVTFGLPVGMQPRLKHERKFEVIATSGEEVRSAELILDVKPIEKPDIYLLVGQSNMVGRTGDNSKQASDGGADETHPRIRQLNVSKNNRSLYGSEEDFSNPDLVAIKPRYIRAQDPLHDPLKAGQEIKEGTTIGPGLSFAKRALSSTTQNIVLVPAAWEASGFCKPKQSDDSFAWNAATTNDSALGGTGLVDRALMRLRITLRDTDGIFRGVLWQQGESDAANEDCAKSYQENLTLLVERIREEAREDRRGANARGKNAAIPFIVSTQSAGIDQRGDYSYWDDAKQEVDAAHRNIASAVPYADWVNNDDLVPPAYPCGSTGCIHFGPLASREIGERFYAALERIWESADE